MHGEFDPHGFQGLLHAIPDYYGSDTEDPIRWILKIDRIAAALNCNEDSKLAVAISRLEGGASDWSEGHTFASWEQFKASFTLRFAESAEVLRHRLQKCRMVQGESIQTFIDRFRMLALRSQIQDPEYLLNRFLAGLSNEIYDRVVVCCPVKYEEAIEKALYFASKLMVSENYYHQLKVRTTMRHHDKHFKGYKTIRQVNNTRTNWIRPTSTAQQHAGDRKTSQPTTRMPFWQAESDDWRNRGKYIFTQGSNDHNINNESLESPILEELRQYINQKPKGGNYTVAKGIRDILSRYVVNDTTPHPMHEGNNKPPQHEGLVNPGGTTVPLMMKDSKGGDSTIKADEFSDSGQFQTSMRQETDFEGIRSKLIQRGNKNGIPPQGIKREGSSSTHQLPRRPRYMGEVESCKYLMGGKDNGFEIYNKGQNWPTRFGETIWKFQGSIT
jgi:hypothetical protein